MARTYNKTCEECNKPFAARGGGQKLCDPCWGEMMGAVRVEYRPINGGYARTAIIVCRECKTECATYHKNQKYPGLCRRCSQAAGRRTPEARANMAAAQRGKKKSPETRAKMSASLRGRKISPEHRAKLRAANIGKKNTPEARAKMSAALRGKKKSPEHRAKIAASLRGRKHTPETRAKMSAAHRNRWNKYQ